jgi:hypothetical protein
MADRLPSFGVPQRDHSKPQKMLYTQKTWTLPSGGSHLTADEWDLRVGNISQAEFDARRKHREVAALSPAQERAMIAAPRSR